MKNKKGITLIALVITIVVLLILAGISISMLGGENGIITRAIESKEENRGGTVEERRDLWKSNQELDKNTNSTTAQTLDELLADLENEGLLTSEEVATIKDVGVITIGSHVIDFTDGEVDWSEMEPGLYETGTTNMLKSWEELLRDGDIEIEGTTLVGADGKGDLVISDTITAIGGKYYSLNGFCGETGFTKIVIPNSVDTLLDYAFKGCNYLTEINIPNTITQIKNYVFQDTSKLTTIHYGGTTEEWNEIEKGTGNIGDLMNVKIICNDGEIN